VIIDHGARQMMEQQDDVFYYVTVMNENYPQPSLREDAATDIVRGMYKLQSTAETDDAAAVRLLGSGAILREVIAASAMLHDDWRVTSDVFSVTSFSELARDARHVERANRLEPARSPRRSHVERWLEGVAPIIAATDYVRAYPQLIASYVSAPFIALGTDGFGRSDTRAALRGFLENDRRHIVVAALHALARQQTLATATVAEAIARYQIDSSTLAPWTH